MGQIEEEDQMGIEQLPNKVYQEALKEIIKNNFDSPVEQCKIVIDAASAKGDNYIGVLYRAHIQDPKGKELNVIIKLPPTNAARREQFHARPCFVRESDFYDTLYPIYKKFQEDKGIDIEKEGFTQVPSCYKSMTEEPLEGLFLEDLKVTGFEMFSRLKDVSEQHVNLVMESLGKLHALSFAIKDQKPELISSFREMKDVLFQREGDFKIQMKAWFDILKKQAAETVSDHPNDDLKKRAEDILEGDFFDMVDTCVSGAAVEPYAVICHGDCWNNNIMYRYENGVPVGIRLLDWQIMRYCSPVCDLSYYIYTCTTKPLRDKHYNDFLDVYYKSFSNFLTRLGSNPEKLFPREVLDDHLRLFGKFGLAMAIMCLPIFTSKVEEIPDMDLMAEKMQESLDTGIQLGEEDMKFGSATPSNAYKERMCGVFEDMYCFNYI